MLFNIPTAIVMLKPTALTATFCQLTLLPNKVTLIGSFMQLTQRVRRRISLSIGFA